MINKISNALRDIFKKQPAFDIYKNYRKFSELNLSDTRIGRNSK